MSNVRVKYVIVDRHTKLRVGKPYLNRARARARADRLDLEYGAYRYHVESIHE
jgi:hypothetical protein